MLLRQRSVAVWVLVLTLALSWVVRAETFSWEASSSLRSFRICGRNKARHQNTETQANTGVRRGQGARYSVTRVTGNPALLQRGCTQENERAKKTQALELTSD